MNTLLVSFVLIHAVWLLGYAAYRLLAGRDTFFRLRRTLLLGLSLAAVAFPLLSQWEGLPVTTDSALPEALATRWLPAVVVSRAGLRLFRRQSPAAPPAGGAGCGHAALHPPLSRGPHGRRADLPRLA